MPRKLNQKISGCPFIFLGSLPSHGGGGGGSGHCYPSDWWKKSVKGFLCELALTSTINFADVDRWCLEGKEFKTRVGADT